MKKPKEEIEVVFLNIDKKDIEEKLKSIGAKKKPKIFSIILQLLIIRIISLIKIIAGFACVMMEKV